MYDPLRSMYELSCPHQGHARLPLSSFRTLARLPGPAHPPVFSVQFECSCGDDHAGLVSEHDLDLAPLGVGLLGPWSEARFHNLMTAHEDSLEAELVDIAARRIGAGEWPWSFFCFLEGTPRPMTPSAIALIAPGDGSFGLAVRCPCCSTVSVNLVTRAHVDIPFWNDERVAVVNHVFEEDTMRAVAEFRAALDSERFDERRLDLER
jgi:hypothetical protein